MATNEKNLKSINALLPIKNGMVDYGAISDEVLSKASALDKHTATALRTKRDQVLAKQASTPGAKQVQKEIILNDEEVAARSGMDVLVFATLPEVAQKALRDAAKAKVRGEAKRVLTFKVADKSRWISLYSGGRYPTSAPAEVFIKLLADPAVGLQFIASNFQNLSFKSMDRAQECADMLRAKGLEITAEQVKSARIIVE